MKKLMGWLALFLAIFIAGVLIQRYWLGSTTASKAMTQKKVLYWAAPMDPTYRRDKPGKSPMGMDLVPVYADDQSREEGIVKISPAVENNLGVKISTVKRENLPRIITTVGYVTVDENNIEHIHTYTDGWIKVLNVKTTGEFVKEGQLLMELYSPTLVNAQEELLLALRNKNNALIKAGEKKLLTLGMAKSQIKQLRQSRQVKQRVKVYATKSGIISKLNVREGKFVKPDSDIMSIENLSQIWIIAEVFERQSNWVKEEQRAIATLPYIPGKMWEGTVDYVYPQLDQQTHTVRVRLTFPNPDLTIKPMMYANVKIFSRILKNALSIPKVALIRTGEGDRVILALGNGRYRAQGVKIGIESGNRYQILSGLKEGDKVVTTAQFLIDSESNLQASFSRMQNGKSDESKQMELSPQEIVGMGKVKSVDSSTRTLLLYHQPIAALNMPAMQMKLPVAENVELDKVKPGDKIQFILIQQSDKTYLITKIQIIKNE